jgi:FtsP/CotA-like multicopper oxidase with cupredoxin domain
VSFAIENSSGERVNLHEYAKDGINMGSMDPNNEIVLQPGYRSDILVKMPKLSDPICANQDPCILDVLDAPSTAATSFLGVSEARIVIAKLYVTSTMGTAQNLPPAIDKHWAKPYPEITEQEIAASDQRTEHIYFTNEPNGDKTVNGAVFPYGDTVPLKLGAAQAWQLWVGKNQNAPGNHPFHIHVNPFEVIKRDPQGAIIKRYWKDTILVRYNIDTEESPLELRSRYEDFTGKFVLHCHNLNHEDAGMMKSVEINP